MVVHLARRPRARPGSDERHAHAAIGEHAFFADQRRVEGTVPGAAFQRTAVVPDEENQRAALLSHRFQLGANLPEPIVHRRDHRERLTAFLGEVGRRSGKPRFRRLQRHVRRKPWQVEKPRLAGTLRATIQKRHGRFRLHRDSETRVRDQPRRIGERRAIERVGGVILSDRAAPVLVESMRVRQILFVDALSAAAIFGLRQIQMPLAAHTGHVARAFQPLRQGDHVEWQWAFVVVLDAKTVLMLASDQSRPRRHALRGGHVTAREPNAVACQLIEMRRADVRVYALRAKVCPAMIVGEDEKDVGLLCGERLAANERQDRHTNADSVHSYSFSAYVTRAA